MCSYSIGKPRWNEIGDQMLNARGFLVCPRKQKAAVHAMYVMQRGAVLEPAGYGFGLCALLVKVPE